VVIFILNWLIEIRRKKNMSQCELANKIGLSQKAISAIETGRRRPSVDTAQAIGSVLEIDWQLFFPLSVRPPTA